MANEAYRETLAVARFERDYKTMAQAHNEIHQFMKKAMQQETVVSRAVCWEGRGSAVRSCVCNSKKLLVAFSEISVVITLKFPLFSWGMTSSVQESIVI